MISTDSDQLGERIEVGDRVRSLEDFESVCEGSVQSIAIGVTNAGPAIILRVMVDTVQGKALPEPFLQESPTVIWGKLLDTGKVQPIKPATAEKPSQRMNPFTPEIIHCYEKFRGCTDREARFSLLTEMGGRLLDEVDFLDPNLPEWVQDTRRKYEDLTVAITEADTALQEAKHEEEAFLLQMGRTVVRSLEAATKVSSVASHINMVMLDDLPEDASSGSPPRWKN